MPARRADRVVGVRPLGHPSLRSRLVVAAAGWVLAVVALPVSIAAGERGSAAAFATELVFLAAYVTALVLTVQLLRSRVAITVVAGEVRIGDLRLPRAELTFTLEPEALVLRVPGRDPVRLAATNRLVAWPGAGRGAQARVPRVMLARLADVLTSSPPADQAFGLLRTGRGWWRDLSPLLAAVAVMVFVDAAVGARGRAGLAVAAVLDVSVFSAAVLLIAVRAWPRPVLRLLVVAAGEVSVVEVHTGRLVERQDRTAVTAQRCRWRTPPVRMTPAVVREGVRLHLGTVVLDVGFPEPAGGSDPAPMMPMPRWMTEPGEGDRLARALAAG
jgi:hypothetical protein